MLRNAVRTGLHGALAAVATIAAGAPSGPQLGPRPSKKGGLNPFAVAGAAFAVGTLLAKAIDWRGHAHPKR